MVKKVVLVISPWMRVGMNPRGWAYPYSLMVKDGRSG